MGFVCVQAHLSSCLEKLMVDVQRNLEPKNRDKFTQVRLCAAWCFPFRHTRLSMKELTRLMCLQNLTIVRHEFRSKV